MYGGGKNEKALVWLKEEDEEEEALQHFRVDKFGCMTNCA
jgi:hypothetical protein